MDKNARPPARSVRALAWLALVALVSSPLLVALVAQAANPETVVMSGQFFNPQDVYVKAGESVRWRNDDPLLHNVTFENGSMNQDVSPGDTTGNKTFSTAQGSPFRYYCNKHGDPGGIGMWGRVIVNSTGEPPPPPSPSPTATFTEGGGGGTPRPPKKTTTPKPTPTPTPTSTLTPTPTPTETPTPTPTETFPSSTPLPTFGDGQASGDDGGSNAGPVAAIVVVAALGGAGYLVYRRFIANP